MFWCYHNLDIKGPEMYEKDHKKTNLAYEDACKKSKLNISNLNPRVDQNKVGFIQGFQR